MNDSVLQQLLQLLADGEFHSGSELGSLLQVSRTAVWKRLKKLDELGVELHSCRGKGYRVPGGLELLDARAIARAMGDSEAAIELLPVVDSTSTRLLSRAATLASGSVCIAEQQSAGRGRRGRVWVSPFGQNLYMSVLWRFEGGATALEGLSLAVGVCIAETLEAFGVPGVQLKWPNDLLASGRKLAGILLEMTGDPAGACQVVVGIGVNMRMPCAAGETIGQPWIDIASLLAAQGRKPVSRNAFCGQLLARLFALLENFATQGFSAWRERWQARAAWLDRPVQLSAGAVEVCGYLRGVDASGALRLEVDGCERLFHGGEVSMRLES